MSRVYTIDLPRFTIKMFSGYEIEGIVLKTVLCLGELIGEIHFGIAILLFNVIALSL